MMPSDSPSWILIVIVLVWALIGIGILVWYLWAMARLFPRIGLKSSDGWIPIWNQWKLLERVALPGWVVLLSFVGLGIVPAIMLIIAMHRINKEYGAGAEYTVLGAFIAPLWATLIANFIGDRAAISGPMRQPQVAPVFQPAANRGFAPGAQPTPTAFETPVAPSAPVPAAFQSQEPGRGSVFLPPQRHYPQAQPVFAPSAPQPWGPAPTAAQVPPAPHSYQAPQFHPVPQGHQVPPAPLPARAPQAPPAPHGPLGGETEAEYDRLAAESFRAAPAVPLGQRPAQPLFSWAEVEQAASTEEELEREPVIPPVHPLAAPAPAAAPAASASASAPAHPAPAASVEPDQVAQPVPATLPENSSPDAAGAPTAPPARHSRSEEVPVEVSQPTPPSETALSAVPAPVDAAPTPVIQMPTGITGKVDLLSAGEANAMATRAGSRRQPTEEEVDLDRTVVVPRAQVPTWVLELPDGTELPIQGDVTVGRRPEAIKGTEALAIPDTTRTLSKSHARLSFIEGRWLVEDLDSTNGLVLIHEDGSENELLPRVQTEATERILFGTLEVRLRPSGEPA